MKYNVIKKIYKGFFSAILLFFLSAYNLSARQDINCQDPFNPPPDCDELPPFDPDNSVPIDGGAGILLVAGVAYGLKRVYDKRKQNKEETDKV